MKHTFALVLLSSALLAGVPQSASATDARGQVRVSAEDELWLDGPDGQAPKRLLAPRPHDDPRRNLSGFNNPALSPDGRVLYVLTTAWATSNALHRMDLSTGTMRFLSDANDFKLLHKGRDAGKIAVLRHVYRPEGGSEDIWFLIAADGKKLGRFTDAKSVKPRERERPNT